MLFCALLDMIVNKVVKFVLAFADDFVNSVLRSAAQMSAARGAGELCVTDVAWVLEKQYNIRIPGYSSEGENRLKRPAPTVGHTKKQNAVQAAKAAKAASAKTDK
jgi:transcription initiation factor TFIID subunit 12